MAENHSNVLHRVEIGKAKRMNLYIPQFLGFVYIRLYIPDSECLVCTKDEEGAERERRRVLMLKVQRHRSRILGE